MLGMSLASKKEQQYVLFDIGSASIGVGIAVQNGKSVNLIWTKRFEYGYQSNDDYNRYVRTMYATLLEAGMKLTSEGFKEAQAILPEFSVKQAEVYCLLSPPWVVSSVMFQSMEKEKPFQVSQASITELQNKGFSEILKKQEVVSWQELMGTPAMLEVYHDVVRLEGYEVQAYEHRTVHELSTQSYFSMVSLSIQEHIKEVLERVLPNHVIHFSSSARIFSVGVHDYFPKRRSIFFEIGGEITSIGCMRQGILTNVTTIPFGTNHILKTIAPNALSAKEARSFLDIFHKKIRSDMSFEVLPENLREALTVWKQAIVLSIEDLFRGVTPPTDMVLLVGNSWYLLYKIALTQPWKLPGVRQVVEMQVQHVHPQKSGEKDSNDVRLLVFAHAVQNCTSKNSVCYT